MVVVDNDHPPKQTFRRNAMDQDIPVELFEKIHLLYNNQNFFEKKGDYTN